VPCGMPPVQLVLIHHSLHKVNMKQAIYNNCDILRQSEKTMCSLRMPCLSLHIPEPYRQNLVPIWRLAAVDQVCPCRLVMVKMEPSTCHAPKAWPHHFFASKLQRHLVVEPLLHHLWVEAAHRDGSNKGSKFFSHQHRSHSLLPPPLFKRSSNLAPS
jgi:hypothetical protein